MTSRVAPAWTPTSTNSRSKPTNPPKGAAKAPRPRPLPPSWPRSGTCAGIYVLGFCRQRGIPTDGIRLLQRMESDPATGLISHVSLDIQLPPAFPEKYRDAVIRSAEQCAVKKHFEHPPVIDVSTSTAS